MCMEPKGCCGGCDKCRCCRWEGEPVVLDSFVWPPWEEEPEKEEEC